MEMVTGALVGSTVSLGIPGAGAAGDASLADFLGSGSGGGAGAPAAGSGGTIKIDVERVPDVIAALDDAIAKVRVIGQKARSLAQVTPPGGDPFSAYAAQSIGETASGGAADHATAHAKYLQVLVETRDKLQQTSEAYKAQDAAGAAGINQVGSS